jgi:hypothetical protein
MNHYNAGTLNTFLEDASNNSTPDIAFTRTQLVELPNTKVRNVFGEAFHYILLEGLTAEPLLDWFIAHDTFYFIGDDPVISVPQTLSGSEDDDVTYLSIDWSQFDASVQPYEIDLAFDLLKTMLYFPYKESELVFDYCKQVFIKRKLLSPDGRMFMRFGGIPSGSYFTHMVDSIINWNRIRYLFELFDIKYDFIRTHGDDGFIRITSLIENFNHVVEHAATLGWFIQLDKCKLTRDISEIEFLGRSSIIGANRRNRMKCLRLCLFPEYPVSNPQISIARLKSIHFDSGGYISEIPRAVEMLVNLYGDENLELPREFRRYNPLDHARNISI